MISNEGKEMLIKVIVEKGEDGYWSAYCPSLKSCWTQGKTEEEALKNIEEAIELYLEPDEELIDNEKHKIYELAI
jgi:predicted RNase H-like HicB family nuclease